MNANVCFTPGEESTLRYYRVPPTIRTTRLVSYYVAVLAAAGVAVWQFFSTRQQDWLFAAIVWLALTIVGVLWRLVQHCNAIASIISKYEDALRRGAANYRR